MKPIIRIITVGNGVWARLGGGGPNGILPGKCGALDFNKSSAINALIQKLQEKYPGQYPESIREYEVINVNQDDNHKPFKPVNTTKSQTDITKTFPVVSNIPESAPDESELGTTKSEGILIQTELDPTTADLINSLKGN